MDALKERDFKKPIIFTKVFNTSSLAIVDNESNIFYLDIDTFDVKNSFSINIKHQRYSTNIVGFSSDGNDFISLSSDNKSATIINTQTKQTKQIANRHHGEISCLAIDPKNRYIFTAGEDGKIFALDIKSDKIAFNLPVHVDTVNDIAFSENGQWVATASYDKKISLYNIAMMKPRFRLKAHQAAVLKLHFLSDYRLFSIDKDSVGIIWNMHDSKIIKRVEGIHDDVVQITTNGDGTLLFLGTKLGYVLVYDLNTYELIDRRFIKLSHTISSLSFNKKSDYLIVGTDIGKLYLYDIYNGQEYIKELLLNKKYKEVEEFIKEKQLLKYTDAYQSIVLLWEKTLKLATNFLGKNEKEKAMQVFAPFMSIASKKQSVEKLLVEYEEFDKFILFVSQAKYSLAYSLVNKHPIYKETNVYKSMELQWKKDFLHAQKTLVKTKSPERVREILSPYRGVSEKTKLIQDLLLNANVYERFKALLVKKDYKACFELVKLHSFLKEYKEYYMLENELDNIYIQSQKLLQKGNKHTALKLLQILLDFEDFKEDAKDMIIEIQDNL